MGRGNLENARVKVVVKVLDAPPECSDLARPGDPKHPPLMTTTATAAAATAGTSIKSVRVVCNCCRALTDQFSNIFRAKRVSNCYMQEKKN